MVQSREMIDALVVQLPLLLLLAGANERLVELTLSFIKKVIKIDTKKVKEKSAVISFMVACVFCAYSEISLLPGFAMPDWLNTILAAGVISLGTKFLHDFAEWIGAISVAAKTNVSNPTRKTF